MAVHMGRCAPSTRSCKGEMHSISSCSPIVSLAEDLSRGQGESNPRRPFLTLGDWGKRWKLLFATHKKKLGKFWIYMEILDSYLESRDSKLGARGEGIQN